MKLSLYHTISTAAVYDHQIVVLFPLFRLHQCLLLSISLFHLLHALFPFPLKFPLLLFLLTAGYLNVVNSIVTSNLKELLSRYIFGQYCSLSMVHKLEGCSFPRMHTHIYSC